MICPIDLVQMHQYKKIGGGEAREDYYQTWELKECPACDRIVREEYIVEVITPRKAMEIKDAWEWGMDYLKKHPEAREESESKT